MDFPRTSPTSALCLSVTPFLTVLTQTHHGPFYLLWSTFVLVSFSYMCHCEVFLVSYIQIKKTGLEKSHFCQRLNLYKRDALSWELNSFVSKLTQRFRLPQSHETKNAHIFSKFANDLDWRYFICKSGSCSAPLNFVARIFW